ncbi:MAG: PD40 domain-containing protein [Planctomycetaceae bacterium]|nr:PD40 domain-containing protein [Planctomycetaceae bacterium]
MRTSRFLFSGALCVCFTLSAFAQEAKKTAEPISLDNVDKVGLLSTGKNDALFLENGPGSNELLLISRDSTTIVDDKSLMLLRKIDASQSKGLTFSKDQSLTSWFEGEKTIIRNEKTGATVSLNAGKDPGSAAFSPDNTLLAVGEAVTTEQSEGSGYSVVRVFESATGKLIHTLDTGHDGYGAVRPVFSPDGKVLAVGNRNFETRIFDVSTGKQLHVLPKRMTQEIAFSPDGKTLAAAYVDGQLGLWDIKTGTELHMVDSGCPEIFSVAWNSTGDVLATCGPSGGKQTANAFVRMPGKVLLWNAKTFTIAKELMEVQWSGRVRFSRDDTRIIATVKEMRTLDDSPRLVVWSTDAPVALSTSASNVQIPMRAARESLSLPSVAIPTVAVSPDGGNVYAPLNNGGELAMWDLTTGDQTLVFKGQHASQIWCVGISPDGSTVATTSRDKTAKLWDAKTGDLLATMECQNDRLNCLTYSPSGKYIVTGTGKQWPHSPKGPVSARIWDATTGKQVSEFKVHQDTIRDARFSADETHVLTSSEDHTARLWEVVTGKETHVFSHTSSITSMAFSPDGKKILTASAGWQSHYIDANGKPAAPSTKLWDAATGKLLIETPHQQGVTATFSESGDQIVTASRGVITFYDTASGKELATHREPKIGTDVVFCPNGRYFVVITPDEPLELWSIVAQEPVCRMEFASPYLSFFSHDSRNLYSLTRGGEFRSWSTHRKSEK